MGGAGIGRVVAERVGVGANLDDCLDFLPDSVGQACFPLSPEPPSAPPPPSALGSACDRRAAKRAEPADFGVLGPQLGGLFGAGAKKGALGGLLGARLEML